jgi:Zn-dependent protease with chaperone function
VPLDWSAEQLLRNLDLDTVPLATIHEVVRHSPYAWAGLATTLASVYVVAGIATWLGLYTALRTVRRRTEIHWTERARLAWPGRRLGRVSFAIICPCLMISYAYSASLVELIPRMSAFALVFVVAYIGATQVAIGWGQRVNPASALTPRSTYAAWIFNLSIIGPFMALVFAGVGFMGEDWNAQSIGIMAGSVLAVGLYLGWGWVRLMRWCGIIRPASERLSAVAQRVAQSTDVRPVAVQQVGLPMANAFAFFTMKSIGVSDATLSVLGDDELATVCAHELAHLGEPRSVLLARLSIGFVIGLVIAIYECIMPVIKLYGLGAAILVYVGGTVFLILAVRRFARIARRMEVRADALARGLEATPGTYARALERIYAANLVPVVLGSKGKSHPELYDRMTAAGVAPEYFRPQPPSKRPFFLGLLVMLITSLFLAAVLRRATREIADRALDPEAAAIFTIGAEGGSFAETILLLNRYGMKADHDADLPPDAVPERPEGSQSLNLARSSSDPNAGGDSDN